MRSMDWNQLVGKIIRGNNCLWLERIINLQRTMVYVFSDSVLCLGKIHENPQSNNAWEDRLGWFITSPEHRNLDRIDGEPIKFEWNIFPGFNTLQLSQEVRSLMLKLGETPEMLSRSHFLSNRKKNTISKTAMPVRNTGEEPVVAKSRPMSLISRSLSANQSPLLDSGMSYSPGIAELVGILISQALRNQGGTEMTILFQVPRNRGEKYRMDSERRSWPITISRSEALEILRKSSRMFRQKLNRPEDGQQVLDQKVNVWMWRLFVSATMKAAIHFGENYKDNLFTHRNTDFEALKTLFDITQKLNLNQKHEIKQVSAIEWDLFCYMTK